MTAPKVCMSPEELAVWRKLNRMLVQMRLEQQEYAYPVIVSDPIDTSTPSPDDEDTQEDYRRADNGAA